jgi:hypothetical protein
MSITLPVFTSIEDTLFLTLCGGALDNQLPHPILGDTMSADIVRMLDYDCNKFRLSASPIIDIAHRAKKLDGVAQKFISGHPTAVGLDLGAGLDTRIFRVNPPPTIDWYDVDFPDVIDDPREPERWNPRLKLIKEILLTREPEVAQFPLVLRLFTRLAAHSTAFSRRGTTVLHYGF